MSTSAHARGARLVALLGLGSALLSWACTERPGQADAGPVQPSLCGLPARLTGSIRLGDAPGIPTLEVLAEPASLKLDNASAVEASCTFEAAGPGLTAEHVYFRFPSANGKTGRAEDLGPGRVRVSMPVFSRAYNLVSFEPPVQPLPDPYRLELPGLVLGVERGAFLRLDDERPVIQALGVDTAISVEARGDRPVPVALRLQNTSDRLSAPASEGLAEASFRREGQLTLHFTGVLPAGGKGRIFLRPRPLTRPYDFLVGGDIKEQLGIFVSLVEIVRQKHDPLFMISVGDFTRNSLPSELDAYFERTADLPFPIYPIKGNHETYCQGDRHYARRFGPGRYAFPIDDLFFAVLDSNRWDERGYHLGEEQLQWLDRILAENSAVPWKIVCTHVPPYPMHTSAYGLYMNLVPEDSLRLRSIAAAHGVAYVLSGHIHLYARLEENGTVYLTSAGGGSRLDGYEAVPGMQILLGKHLMVLTVGPGGIEEERVVPPRPLPEVPR